MNSELSNAERKTRSAIFYAQIGLVILLVGSDHGAWAQARPAGTNRETAKTQTREKNSQDEKQAEVRQADIAKWIRQLSDESFLIRNSAKNHLKEAGERAFSQLFRARDAEDLEARLTVRELLEHIEVEWVWGEDSPEVEELMLDFQFRKVEDRMALVDRLSWLATDECWTALFRIMIYDKSDIVCDRAAARLMEIVFLRDRPFDNEVVEQYLQLSHLYSSQLKPGEKLSQQTCDAAFEAVRSSQGLGLKNTFLIRAIDALGQWIEKAKTDYASSGRLADSLFLQIRSVYSVTASIADAKRFKQLGELDVRVLKLLELESETSLLADEDLIRLAEVLLDNQRWDAASQLFANVNFDRHAPLVSMLNVRLLLLTGDKEGAEKKLASVASQIESPAQSFALFAELDNREMKASAAMFAATVWANQRIPTSFQIRLAEIHFDLQDLAPSRAMSEAVLRNSDARGERIRAMWVLSRIAKESADPKAEISWLNRLIELNPLSANVLVRLHELRTMDGFDEAGLKQKISIAQGAFRDQVRLGRQMSQSSTPAEENLGKVKWASGANSLAWLLTHLGEDLEEAQEMAQMAVALEPRNSGYLDTLAFCEFERGNRQAAIALQKRAVYLSPDQPELKLRLDKYLEGS